MINRGNNLDLALVMCPGWSVVQPPVGISYLKGFLKEHGMSVRCFDLNLDIYKFFPKKEYWDLSYSDYFISPRFFEKYILSYLDQPTNKWSEQILNYNPKIVGLSLFKSSINISLLLAQQLKRIKPDLIILGGGPEATRIKRLLVDGVGGFADLKKDRGVIACSVFDLLIDGEGEEALLEVFSLLRKKRDFHHIQGCLYMDNGKIVTGEARGLINDLDILSPPDFHDFELESYTRKSLPLVTSRGCINRCTFCADSPLWKLYRYRSPEKVLEEIKFLIKEYNINEFEITDSTLNCDIQRLERICDLIIESRLGIQWTAKATLRKEMSFELLQRMKKAGCNSLAYGVESGSPFVLKDMRKNFNLDEVKRIIRDTFRAGINADCFFMVGYPTETEYDFQLTMNFVRENAEFINCFPSISGCNIEEDSYLGLNLNKYDIIFKEDGWHSKHSCPQIRKERLDRFRELAKELCKNY